MIRPKTLVLAALAVLVLLGSTLGIRYLTRFSRSAKKPAPAKLARFTQAAPPAQVPAPKSAALLDVPNWGAQTSDGWPVRFRTDLDLLAPLGNGNANAALWLKDFAREVGAREAEAEAAMKRRVPLPGSATEKVLPADDPLLKEAEPWADQGTMRFYPDVFPIEGFATRIPNLALSLAFAKAWVARAEEHPEAPAALEDCRRAIRWGRLLRQEDTTLIQDLVGLAAIRAGAQGLYDVGVKRGDQPLALAAAIVLGEHAPQRLRTAELVTRVNVIGDGGGVSVTDRRLDGILEVAKGSPDRRFRFEALTQLALVHALGSRAQQAKVEKTLDELSESKDPLVASTARWARAAKIDEGQMRELGI